MVFSCVFFFVASGLYVKVKPDGSPVAGIFQVLVAAFRKRHVKLPNEPKHSLYRPPHSSSLVAKLPYTGQMKFLDRAAIVCPSDKIESNGVAGNFWKLCSMQQVEEVKCLVRIIPIWSTGIIYYVAVAQQSTYVVFQALQSDKHPTQNLEIPAASFTIFSSVALSVWMPLYDRVLVPLRKITKRDDGFSPLQRMGVGLVFSILAMFVSGLVEVRRRSFALHERTLGTTSVAGGAVSAMSSFWLVPQLLLLGISEAFNSMSQLEFYYKQFPENMRSVAGSLPFCGIAIASYLSGLMVIIVHHVTGRESWLP